MLNLLIHESCLATHNYKITEKNTTPLGMSYIFRTRTYFYDKRDLNGLLFISINLFRATLI